MITDNATKLLKALPMKGKVNSTRVRKARAGVLSTYIADEMDNIKGPDFLWDVEAVNIMILNCPLAMDEL